MPDDLRVPEATRLVHIGPHKTGSTAIQVSLFQARAALAEHGVYYPGKARRRRGASEQLFRAAKNDRLDGPLKHWDALAAEVAAAGDQRVCVSDELFGKAPRETVAKIVSDLGGERAHIVAVARPLHSYLPSQWQERVKAGRGETFDEWMQIVLGDSTRHFEKTNVWHAHDTKALVDRWLEFVDPERFTLVVANESDRTQLPRVFETLLGLPTGLLELVPDRSNQSLVLAEVELIRAVNERLRAEGVPVSEYQSWLKHAIRAAGEYDGPRTGPRKPAMPAWAVAPVEELSAARVETVKALPVRVVGDPEWLRGRPKADQEADEAELNVSAALAGDAVARVVAAALRGQRA